MHFHTTPALFAAVEADKLMAVGVTLIPLLIVIGITVASSIFGNWAASHMLVKEKATFGRAILTFFTQIAWGVLFAMILGLVYFFLGMKKADPILLVVVMLVAFVLLIYVAISVPMQIYDISASRAFGFNVLSSIIGIVLSNVANLTVAGPAGLNQLSSQVEKAIATAKAKQLSASDGKQDLRQRHATLQRRYQQLEIRRRYLPPNDRKAFVDYERDRAAYERDLEQLRADSAP